MVSDERSFAHLFSPVRVGTRQLRNRVVAASVVTNLPRDGEVTDGLISFLRNRAAGGAAMIVAEPFVMWHRPGSFTQARVHGSADLTGFTRIADAVHSEGSLILGQITEQGRGDMRGVQRWDAIAPSALPDELSWTMPRPMAVEDIDRMIAEMTLSTARLKDCGFDGIEISGGHGHIFHQFLSPRMNLRTDEYGGVFDNRVRVLDRLLRSIRNACGPEFIIGLRLPGSDGLEGSLDWSDARQLAAFFSLERRTDYLNFVQGAHAWTLHQHLPDMHGPRGPYVEQTGVVRSYANGVPVAATGRITEAAQADSIIRDGQADLIMLGRTLIADPAWPKKSASGRDGEIRKCVSCNNCWAISITGAPTSCDNNPRVGAEDEADWRPPTTDQRKRVVVVGAGIAGLEASWIAAARGHDVHLFSRSAEAGGRVRTFARLPGCDSISSIYDYQIAACDRAGVRISFSHEVTTEEIVALKPDLVLVASGGIMLWPEQLPTELRDEGFILDLPTLLPELLARPSFMGGKAVVFDADGTEMTYSATEFLASLFDEVILITPIDLIARHESPVKRQSAYRRLMSKGVGIVPWSEPDADSRFEDGIFVHRNVMTGKKTEISDVQMFTYATPRVPRSPIGAALRERGLSIVEIGDARNARSTMTALAEAHAAGLDA